MIVMLMALLTASAVLALAHVLRDLPDDAEGGDFRYDWGPSDPFGTAFYLDELSLIDAARPGDAQEWTHAA